MHFQHFLHLSFNSFKPSIKFGIGLLRLLLALRSSNLLIHASILVDTMLRILVYMLIVMFLVMLRFVGVGARRVRSLFQAAKKKVCCFLLTISQNCLLFWFTLYQIGHLFVFDRGTCFFVSIFCRLLASFSLMKLMLSDQQGNSGRAIPRRHCINYLLKWMGLSRMRYLERFGVQLYSSAFRNLIIIFYIVGNNINGCNKLAGYS